MVSYYSNRVSRSGCLTQRAPLGSLLRDNCMKKLVKTILVLWLISLSLVGCNVFSARPNVFDNPVCKAPCWENITLGITTKTEALNIWSNNKAVDQPVYDSNQSFGMFEDELRFSLYSKQLHGSLHLYRVRPAFSRLWLSHPLIRRLTSG